MQLTVATAFRPPSVDDALQFLVTFLRAVAKGERTQKFPNYGYEIYLPNVVLEYLAEMGIPGYQLQVVRDQNDDDLSRAFYAAAWDLCRRGILRPGLRRFQGQATDQGGSGGGYSVTPYGEVWLREAERTELLPLEPGRFAGMLADVGRRFGPGFVERSQEAVRAYNANAFLACCAMCGAAAESILLALAVAKAQNESRVLAVYSTASGRGRVESLILGSQARPIQDEFHRYTTLLKYWRDSSSHGRSVRMSEPEAYQSLALLLRFARWAEDHWNDLTR